MWSNPRGLPGAERWSRMSWRGVHLSRSAHLAVDHRSLHITFRDDLGGNFHLPLEDLSYLIIDAPDITLTSRLMAEMSSNGIMVVGVDQRHTPCWTSLPTGSFHRYGETTHLQLSATQPTKKRIWQSIVIAKILMQAGCLLRCGKDGSEAMQILAQKVRSGDPDKVEARAARIYWKYLFKDRVFIRHDDDLPNALLNYGYAILRSCLARILCAKGFIPQIGIWHRSQTNAFNLADDLLEPFRPLVDHRAIQVLNNAPSNLDLSLDHRREMALIMEDSVMVNGEKVGLLNSMELFVDSVKRSLSAKSPSEIVFPGFVQL